MEEILRECERLGITLEADGDRLKVIGRLPPELRERLAANKEAILRRLKAVDEPGAEGGGQDGRAAPAPQERTSVYTVLVDGAPEATAGTLHAALAALDAAVRSLRPRPGHTAKVELQEASGKVLRICYLPPWEGRA